VRILLTIAALVIAPPLALLAALAVAVSDLFPRRRSHPPETMPRTGAASIVIPNWNGRELLAKYLPSVLEAAGGNPANEVIVVDNASADGSADFLRENFPTVRVVALEKNRGFGGGSNAGVAAARNDVVVLLNSDMRVAPDFLAPLLAAFTGDKVFAVSCQIFFSDPARRREETGLTEGRWHRGALQVGHRADDRITEPYPCFYGGGGSCAFDLRKFLELGGFDELFAPFYFEDADLGYLAWKRGWQVLYQPRSVVWHEHRGTIGRHYSDARIRAVLEKNRLLFCWKNIHEWRRLAGHFTFATAHAVARGSLHGLWKAVLQLPAALRSRRRARTLAVVSDTEALRRPQGGYFRDRFVRVAPSPLPLRVLFLSPYPICPPVHGGAVFMYNTVRELARHCDVHLLIVLDRPEQRAEHAELENVVASVEYFDRSAPKDRQAPYSLPYAVRDFAYRDLEWAVDRIVFTREIDVVQFEYTNMAQYGGEYRRLACALFEHDVYFQSVRRSLTLKTMWEYLRALRFELRALPKFDLIQACNRANRDYLLSFAPRLAPRIDTGTRTGIDVQRYSFPSAAREPLTMLFLGSFRHAPNLRGFEWFASGVLPRVRARYPEARVIVVGSAMEHHNVGEQPGVEIRGFVPDVREPLGRYALFVCPVLSGSGIRVKLLEAFAAGIPSVATRIGAEGISARDGGLCRLADDGEAFARAIVELLENPKEAEAMARRARTYVENEHDCRRLTEALVESYRRVLEKKRSITFPCERS
jgi:GT2 family glycosyltransferase